MASSRAELIFVAGGQDGQRGLLASNVVLLGRGSSCDVHINEQAVSREQAKLTLTPDGWVIENLSSTRIRINGKKYKAKKQVILDTGDIVAMGLQTELLFVAPGDDADAAIGDYRLAHPVQIQMPQEPPAPPVEEPAPSEVDATGSDEAPASVEPASPSQQDEPEEIDEKTRARKAKVRKYIVAGVIYGVLMIGVIAVLMSLPKDDETEVRRGQGRTNLTDKQIAEALRAPLAGIDRHPTEAPGALADARRCWKGRMDRPDYLYRCVKYFKLYLAYRGSSHFENTRDEEIYLNAMELLIEGVTRKYRAAWVHENQRDWTKAGLLFLEIRDMLPVNEDPGAEKDHRVFKNVLAHINYVRGEYQKQKRR